MVASKGVAFFFVCWLYLIQSLNPSAFVMLEFELLFTPEACSPSRSDQHCQVKLNSRIQLLMLCIASAGYYQSLLLKEENNQNKSSVYEC